MRTRSIDQSELNRHAALAPLVALFGLLGMLALAAPSFDQGVSLSQGLLILSPLLPGLIYVLWVDLKILFPQTG